MTFACLATSSSAWLLPRALPSNGLRAAIYSLEIAAWHAIAHHARDKVRDHFENIRRHPWIAELLADGIGHRVRRCPASRFRRISRRHAHHLDRDRTLPQFGWGQFEVPNAQGDEFWIRDCGPPRTTTVPRSSVSCGASVRPPRRGDALPYFQHADIDVRLHGGAIADFPNARFANTSTRPGRR